MCGLNLTVIVGTVFYLCNAFLYCSYDIFSVAWYTSRLLICVCWGRAGCTGARYAATGEGAEQAGAIGAMEDMRYKLQADFPRLCRDNFWRVEGLMLEALCKALIRCYDGRGANQAAISDKVRSDGPRVRKSVSRGVAIPFKDW